MTLSYLVVQVLEENNYLFPHVLLQTLPAVRSFPTGATTVHTYVVSCVPPFFLAFLEQREGEEAMWRLGRKVYLGQVGFSCAEMMSLCFLDNPLLLPTHGRRGEAPSPSPVEFGCLLRRVQEPALEGGEEQQSYALCFGQ